MKKCALLLLSVLLPLSAVLNIAQARPADWYQIEVVIFAQSNNPSVTELWRDTFSPDYTSNPLVLGHDNQVASPLNPKAETNISDGAFQLLPDTERTLNFAARRIKNSADLRFLSHLAWRQPVPRGASPQSVLIKAGQQFNDEFELEGTLSIRRNRYLHARSELFFSRFEQMKSVQELDWTVFSGDDLEFGQRDWNPSFNETESGNPQYVRASTAKSKQSRRMRSGELHYIDHPLFGLLVQITPYKMPDPAMDLRPIPLENLPAQRPLPDSAISPNL